MAVAIPYSRDEAGRTTVCLVSSRKHDGLFVLPKGGIEKGESGWQSAVREMWEEGKAKGGRDESVGEKDDRLITLSVRSS